MLFHKCCDTCCRRNFLPLYNYSETLGMGSLCPFINDVRLAVGEGLCPFVNVMPLVAGEKLFVNAVTSDTCGR